MKSLKNAIGDLKTINEFTPEDLKKSSVSEEMIQDFIRSMEKEKITKECANKETKEFLKQETARIHALKKTFGSTKDFVKKVSYTNEGETLAILISDWHVGKVIIDEFGKQLYNTEIAIKTLTDTFVRRITKLIKRIGINTCIEEVVIMLAGDLIENEIIYTTQMHHIDTNVFQQRHSAVKGLLQFVDAIEQTFAQMGKKNIPIRIEGVRGNHGRVGTGTTAEESSWDIVIYDELDMIYAAMKKPNIEVNFSLGDYRTFEVRGHKALLRHTAPIQSETNSARGKFGGWCEMFDWDFMCYGHFHHWGMFSYNGRPIFRNGALCGNDSLATEMAVRDRPNQVIFGISDKEVPTFMYKVNLD